MINYKNPSKGFAILALFAFGLSSLPAFAQRQRSQPVKPIMATSPHKGVRERSHTMKDSDLSKDNLGRHSEHPMTTMNRGVLVNTQQKDHNQQVKQYRQELDRQHQEGERHDHL